MNPNKERHYFLGGNTYKGFHSFYHYIIDKENANRVICIKGGPGTGKSHLMKRVAKNFLEKGYLVEFHHCSSDNNSLDGVVIPDLKIALLDGTAPHMIDPIYPGTVDEILNLGIALDNDSLSLSKKELIDIYKEISDNFKKAYRFLASAKPIHEDWSLYNFKALNYSKIITITESLKEEVFSKQKSGFGTERHLFGTAFTPNGIISFNEDLSSNYNNKFILNGGPGFSKTIILTELGKIAQRKGFFVEYLHDPFNPERIENIFIPEISTAILTENEISNNKFSGKFYNIENFCDTSILNKYKESIEYDKNLFDELINKALFYIENAHKIHDDLESYYIKALDFSILNNAYNDLINKLEKYCFSEEIKVNS